MRIFYRKSLHWEYDNLRWKNYREVVGFIEGYNHAYDRMYNSIVNTGLTVDVTSHIKHVERVKIFGYEYNSENNLLRIAQVVWKHVNVPNESKYWTNKLRRSHLKTLEGRFNKGRAGVNGHGKYHELYVDAELWASLVDREEFVERMFMRSVLAQKSALNENHDKNEVDDNEEDVEGEVEEDDENGEDDDDERDDVFQHDDAEYEDVRF